MTEKLKYITLDETGDFYQLLVQLDKGGAGITLKKGDPASQVVNSLQWLVDQTKNGSISRDVTNYNDNQSASNMTKQQLDNYAIQWIVDNAPDFVHKYLDREANKNHLYVVSLEMALDDLEKQLAQFGYSQ